MNEQATPQEIRLKSSPKDVFYHLLAIVTLYVSVISFIALLFQYINVWFPDQLNFYYQGALDGIRWATSALLIVWPVYVLMSWLIGKEEMQVPQKRELRVRKWLLYLTLFIAAITIIVDLIRLVYNFYSGDLTIRFFLMVVVVLAVAGGVFGYYIWDLRRGVGAVSPIPKRTAWGVSALVIVSIATGFLLVGSPAKQRQVRLDEQRTSDLQVVQNEIVNYWINKDRLPASLDELINDISGFVPPVDPDTLQPYEYRAITALSFEVCANFQTSSQDGGTNATKPVPIDYGGPLYQANWSHDAGRACFRRTIDPEMYKSQKGG
ncbi:MAG: hypothetical protein A2722_01720 [Candidatus Doudnabacteria bacterium RIFCSPHIGHO2_01_FULL_50_11]|uniref:DUF5671 domain-containing protein n=1 Tax=Candidatus Doudnabacteria bacterium RIFCSPHIGHO2_01_FULL_50_11 TaxID=1817828 RepID=A0A1F5PEX9_9BACT|nr:MAG: hypothetical protein A2722_01720 [Candidatus Doudnabacteria bacterium RIFCSPHIGHO2_01_FULL_50_11]HLC44551.1 DUF5671 domain-containing protein [Patescibacteria group bacterium]